MKRLRAFLIVCALLAASNAQPAPEVSEVPFEPRPDKFFRPHDKYAYPPEIAAPRFLFPFEFNRGAGARTPAEVIILVELDGRGTAKRLKVLTSPHPHFTRSALDALEKAKWDSAAEIWFYYRHVYTLDE